MGTVVLLIRVRRIRNALLLTTLLVTALLAAAPALAGERTVVLSIPTMDCDTCPLTIRVALLKVAGVSRARVSYKEREARVTYDEAQTSVDALRAATRDVGYPALVK
ncbi:MAG TPA: mercury resistance system periplasmic binding protein MerP [Steroidobacteraceae bacterium]|nr:mercury resistance system periplasmic binding protein MerP [Steroidobacteraceae bacterium]